MMEKFVEHGYLEILGIPLALFCTGICPMIAGGNF